MNAIFPASEWAGNALQPSFVVAGVPVKTISPLPDCGTDAREPAARL
jgi:hypothetical protein